MLKVTNSKGLIALTQEELQQKLDEAFARGYEEAKKRFQSETKATSKAKRTVVQNGNTLEIRNGIVEG